MSFLDFLRGGLPPTPWRLEHRSADGAPGEPWRPLGGEETTLAVFAVLAAPLPGVPAYHVVRATAGARREHWFTGDDGRSRPLPEVADYVRDPGARAWALPWGSDWVGAWWACERGDHLLELGRAHAAPPAALVALGCAAARRVVVRPGGLASGEPRRAEEQEAAFRALDLTERWAAAGMPDEGELARDWRAAGRDAWRRAIAANADDPPAATSRWAVAHACMDPDEPLPDYFRAAQAAARAGAVPKEQRAQADLVRERLPLAALLLAATSPR